MSEAEKEDKEKWTLKQKCADCVKGPKNVVKTLILMICVAAVLQQISACVRKLIDIPITTYTHFDFNKTIMYPSVTFCRDPPYKISRMRDYGLDRLNPDIAAHWKHFDFKRYSLDEVWENITLNVTDMFVSYGLDKLEENVELIPTMGFTQGRCYTMSPKTLGTEESSGYSVTLQHTLDSIAETGSINPPGYHVYIHYTKEPFTEVAVYNGGLVEKLYVNVGETLQVKLKVDKYLMISTADDPCEKEPNYSANACTTQFVWEQVGRKVGCSGPWMQSELPRCKNYSSMLELIFNYNNLSKNHRYTRCPRTCDSYIYNGYVTDRQKRHWDSGTIDTLMSSDFVDDSELQTTVKLYFGSMMVSVYEERYNYDGNMFLSDLGGSIGFLLGLSVIGLLEVFSKFWTTCIEPLFPKKKKAGSITSSDTADLQSRQEYIDEWNLKNVK